MGRAMTAASPSRGSGSSRKPPRVPHTAWYPRLHGIPDCTVSAGVLAERRPDPALLKILDTVSERTKEYQFNNRIKRKKIIKGQGEQA